jgi:hypothetical protein
VRKFHFFPFMGSWYILLAHPEDKAWLSSTPSAAVGSRRMGRAKAPRGKNQKPRAPSEPDALESIGSGMAHVVLLGTTSPSCASKKRPEAGQPTSERTRPPNCSLQRGRWRAISNLGFYRPQVDGGRGRPPTGSRATATSSLPTPSPWSWYRTWDRGCPPLWGCR